MLVFMVMTMIKREQILETQKIQMALVKYTDADQIEAWVEATKILRK